MARQSRPETIVPWRTGDDVDRESEFVPFLQSGIAATAKTWIARAVESVKGDVTRCHGRPSKNGTALPIDDWIYAEAGRLG
jgi:hypothetical protein